MDHNIGQKIDGRYEITELIGIGGMADVYKATDIMENKTVAVKILKTEFSGNEDFIRRFRNESKAIAVLSHPNIVKIFDVGFTDKVQYIVMEYIDGITLKEFMEQQSVLKWKDAIHFTIQILRALQHAHDRGIVHRDIKPQNIMLFPDGTIKVMDFGIARFSREEGKTLSDKTIGSVHYISPEQARGDITDEKSDIYSVGAMLYEMLTGKKPFEADTPVAVALMHMQDPVRLPREINDTIPEGLEEIILHAMQKNPSNRYQSASEMIKDLETFKLNPTVLFGYSKKMVTGDEDGSTIFFKPLAKSYPDEEVVVDEEEDEEEDEEKSSLIMPVLTGVTVGIVVIAAIIICILLLKLNKSADKANFKLPNFVGASYSEVEKEYKDKLKFDVSYEYSAEYEEGIVFHQDPAEGKIVNKGYKVKLKVSKGQRLVEIPDLTNKSFDNAKVTLQELGFEVSQTNVTDDNIAKDYVVKTDPSGNTKAPYGSVVTVYVSQGPTSTTVTVPKVEGLTQADAIEKLTAVKLKGTVVPINSDKPEGTVVSQSVAPNTTVSIGTEIVLRVSTGNVVDTEVIVDLPVGNGATGSYTVTGYDPSGNPIGSATITKGELANKVSVKLVGKGNNIVVKFEVKSNDTKKSILYAQATVNFIDKTSSTPQVINPNAFAEAVKSDEGPKLSITTDLPDVENLEVGGTLNLNISVKGGSGMLTYQWYRGSEKVGGNNPSLTINNLTPEDAGDYYVMITDSKGNQITSKHCYVTVT